MGSAVHGFTTSPPLVRLVAMSFVSHLFKTLLERILVVELTVGLRRGLLSFISLCTPTQLCLGLLLNENEQFLRGDTFVLGNSN